MPLAYNLLLLLASPLLALYLLYRLWVKGKSREGLAQRLGGSPRLGSPPPAGRVWMHAVSAGEVVAAAAVASRLRELAPEVELAVSCTTPAGRLQAVKLIPHARAHFYFPFDFLPCIVSALRRVRPTVIVTVETEVWPNWLWVSRLLGIRTAMVNGQFADKGFSKARKARWLYRWALGQVEALWMQSDQAAKRALFLGAPPGRVRVAGNVKFEQATAAPPEEAIRMVRERLLSEPGARLFLAGSTHSGEEEQVLESYRRAREDVHALRLLLVPRHIERAQEVLALVEQRALTGALRTESAGNSIQAPVDVLVLDTIGELAGLYALADVVFVGGSLVPVGGHDILQPLFHGKPVLFGPQMHNQADLSRLALEGGAAIQVEDAADLASAIVTLCRDPQARDRLARAGAALLRANQGAARECAELIATLARGGSPFAVTCRAPSELATAEPAVEAVNP